MPQSSKAASAGDLLVLRMLETSAVAAREYLASNPSWKDARDIADRLAFRLHVIVMSLEAEQR